MCERCQGKKKPDEVVCDCVLSVLNSCCMLKVCARTAGVFCGVTNGGLPPVTRPLRTWSTGQHPLRTGGNTAAAAAAAVDSVEQEGHRSLPCLLTRCLFAWKHFPFNDYYGVLYRHSNYRWIFTHTQKIYCIYKKIA